MKIYFSERTFIVTKLHLDKSIGIRTTHHIWLAFFFNLISYQTYFLLYAATLNDTKIVFYLKYQIEDISDS